MGRGRGHGEEITDSLGIDLSPEFFPDSLVVYEDGKFTAYMTSNDSTSLVVTIEGHYKLEKRYYNFQYGIQRAHCKLGPRVVKFNGGSVESYLLKNGIQFTCYSKYTEVEWAEVRGSSEDYDCLTMFTFMKSIDLGH